MTTPTTTAATTTSSMIPDAVEFDDIFHVLNEDLDAEANEWPYLNNFYLNFEDEIPARDGEEELNRSNTSQRHSSIVSILQKKITENSEAHRYFYGIPDYLSASSSSFQTKFFTELRNVYDPIGFQDLQELAVLTHQTSIIHLHEQLWHCFLQASKGLLKQSVLKLLLPQDPTDFTPTLSFWSKIVTSTMMSKGILPPDHRQDKIDQNIYVNFIQNYLHQLEEQAKKRQLQFNTIVNRLSKYATNKIKDKIESFLQNEESLCAMRLHFQRRIALLEYISMDRSYQLAYFQQKPTNLQLQIVKQICSLTFDKNSAEQEMLLYKFDFVYKKFPKSFDILETSPPTSITTLSDPAICQRLSNDFEKIIQRTKSDLMMVFTRAAEAKRDDSRKKFDKEIEEIWKNHRQQPKHQRLTPTMSAIMEQRQKNVTECVKWICHLKGDFYVKVSRRTLSVMH